MGGVCVFKFKNNSGNQYALGILPQEPRVEQDLDGRNRFSYSGSLVEKLACESAA